MWPQILDLTIEECMKRLRAMELDTYMRILSVIRAKGSLCDERRRLLRELAILFNISKDRQLAEARRVSNNEVLTTIAYRLTGRDWCEEWEKEGRSSVPPVYRFPPLTVNTPLADKVALLATSHGSQQHVVKKAIAETVARVNEASCIKDTLGSERCSETGDTESEIGEDERINKTCEEFSSGDNQEGGYVQLPSGVGVYITRSSGDNSEMRISVKASYGESENCQMESLPSGSSSLSSTDLDQPEITKLNPEDICQLTNGEVNSEFCINSEEVSVIETSVLLYNDQLVSDGSEESIVVENSSKGNMLKEESLIPEFCNGVKLRGDTASSPFFPSVRRSVSAIGKRHSSSLIVSESIDGCKRHKLSSNSKLLKLNVKGIKKFCSEFTSANVEPIKVEELLGKIMPISPEPIVTLPQDSINRFSLESPSSSEENGDVKVNGDGSIEESVSGSQDSYLSSRLLPSTVQLHRKAIFSSDDFNTNEDPKSKMFLLNDLSD